MLAGVIEKRPWSIIVAWIIIVALLAQYAGQLDSVVKTQTESFLPEKVESVKADKELSRILGNNTNTGSAAGYMILVHNVPVDLDTYYKLKAPYSELRTEYNRSLFSWIDIITDIEEKIQTGLTQGVNQTVKAVKGVLEANDAYINGRNGVNQSATLIMRMDSSYVRLYNSSVKLESQIPGLRKMEETYYIACNKLLPALVTAYYDATRAEAILENYTSAYQRGTLNPEDIQTVESYTNLTEYGIPPVDQRLIQAVFYTVLSKGGPQVFNNLLALGIAENATWEAIASNTSQEEQARLKPLYQLVVNILVNDLANNTQHKELLLQSGNIYQAQLSLLQVLLGLEENEKPALVDAVTSMLEQSMPAEVAGIAEIMGKELKTVECNETTSYTVLKDTIKTLLETKSGISGNPMLDELADEIANESRPVSKETVMGIIKSVFLSSMQELGVPKADQLVENAAQIILWWDPNAEGLLASETGALRAATYLLVKGVNPELKPSDIPDIKSPDDAAYFFVENIFTHLGQPQLTSLLEALRGKGLLGVSEDKLVKALPDVLAPSIAEKGNMSINEARVIVETAVKVYTGNTSLDEAVDNLTRVKLADVFPDVIKRFRGIMVEKNLTGFIIAYNPQGGENPVETFKKLEGRVDGILRETGFNPVIYLGGTDFMEHEMREGAQKDIEKSDKISMALVLVILALVLESVAAVILPFIGIGFGLVTSLALAFFLAKSGLLDITTHSRTIMYTTGLGLGVDYAAYISKRFREAAAEGLDSRKAAAKAFRKGWKPVLTGALTASIGFGSMLVARDFPFVTSIGKGVPLAILSVMLASITFIPALLAYVGERNWFWWPRHPVETARKNKGKKELSRRLLAPIVSKPLIPLAIIVVMAAGAAIVMTGFQGSYDMSLNLPRDSESAKSLNVINTYYDPGILYPVHIVLSTSNKTQDMVSKVGSLSCVSNVIVKEGTNGRVVDVYMSVNPVSHEGVDCASQIRKTAHMVDSGSLVGGMSPVYLDLTNLINDEFYHRVYPVAIILMFITLLAAYGGVATALSAVIAVVLAAYAGSALAIVIYENLMGQDVLWFLPVIVFTAILGVGMDYNSFYLARAREECEEECGPGGVVESMVKGTPIIIGLATIMAGAYIGLAATSTPGLSEMGSALVFGVLLAGLNASILLTPPVVALMKDKAWWPLKPGGGKDGSEED